MPPRISVITLGVADMARSLAFYRDGLGLPAREDKPPVIYFELQGTWLALFPRDGLAGYAGVGAGGEGFDGVTLSCNVSSADEVDRMVRAAEAAGARVTSAPRKAGWGGYTGWFADPDGHLWEIVYNPRPFIP
ncbi:MAG: VOC family protein [Gammaproteobacteria bacterium]|nr:VOC family protein [Gammaproteobacteria bacterium]